MAVLSNNGRLISSLPVASQLLSSDQFIIQSVNNVNPNGITQRATYGFIQTDLNNLIIANIQSDSTLKFSGSFYSPDNKISNFHTTKIRAGLTVTTGGITVSAGASSFQSVTATQFNGPLTGNVNAGSILVSGTGNFGTIIVTNTIAGNITSAGLSTFANLQMAGGLIGGTPGAVTINNSPIGDTAPSTISGTKITGSLGIKSLLGLAVDSFAKITGTTYANGGLISNKISASLGLTGSLRGTFTGDVFSPTGVKVLENGSGIAKKALFYGTSSYASSSFRAISASYALKTITTNSTTFALSSSYASSSRFNISSSFASSSFKSRFTFSSSYASSSLRSKFTFSSSYASSSRFNISSSFASASISSSFTKKTRFSISSSWTSASVKSFTSSYVLQGVNRTKSIPVYNGTALVGASQLNYNPYGNTLYLKLSGSYNDISTFSNTAFTIESPSIPGGGYSSKFVISSDLNRKGRTFHSTYGDDYLAGGGPEGWLLNTFDSGSFALQSWWESYNFNNHNYVTKLNSTAASTATLNFAKIINNDIYFWGESYSHNSSMRDGAIGIGLVQPTNQTIARTTKARVHINVFSASKTDLGKGAWTGEGTVRDLPAILVTYGSGSVAAPFNKTFYVSGSGESYVGGTITCSKDVYVGNDLHVTGQLKGVASAGFAKAWVNFGFPIPPNVINISSSYNIASITRKNPGDYVITFINNFSDTTYIMMGLVQKQKGAAGIPGTLTYATNGLGTKIIGKTISSSRVYFLDGDDPNPAVDPLIANIVFFGY